MSYLIQIYVAVAGGTENMDQAPYLVARGRWGFRMGDGALYDSVLRDGLNDAFSDAHSGWHTEDLVEKYQVTRDAQDRWALRSQQRFAAAQAAGHFKTQIVPVEVPGKKGPTQFDKDEGNRPDTTLEVLARLKPAFRPNGTITAGNAPGLNDAAAAMVLTDETWADKRGLGATARLVSYGIAAVEPGMFGLGPVPAVKQALRRAGWDASSVERVEINEAFAAIAIVVARELGFGDDFVNVEGGAVAHGHPIGATGAVLTTKIIHSMRRDGLKRGLVTLCIGGGQASRWRSRRCTKSRRRSINQIEASAPLRQSAYAMKPAAPLRQSAYAMKPGAPSMTFWRISEDWSTTRAGPK